MSSTPTPMPAPQRIITAEYAASLLPVSGTADDAFCAALVTIEIMTIFKTQVVMSEI